MAIRHGFSFKVGVGLLMGLALSLSACGDNVSTGVWVDPTADLVKTASSAITYHDVASQIYRTGSSYPYNAMPSKGNVNVLVVPIEFKNYPFAQTVVGTDGTDNHRLTDLNTLFNGSDEETKYWKSLSGFYKESSFDQLNITATIASVYEMNQTPEEFLTPPENGKSYDGTSKIVALMRTVITDYKTKNGADSTKKFDSDGDGVIDGLYLIYSCYDYQRAKKHNLDENESYWAFSTNDNSAPNIESPVGGNFMWASYDFMYTGVAEKKGVDSHTFVHETGHLLGLDDYYNYDDIENNEKTAPKYRRFAPMGALDMMDYNILDHDIWSKFALGWASPYVVDSSIKLPVTVTLKDSVSSKGDFLIIPSVSGYNGTAFGEYLVVELYAPTGLNALDATTSYGSTRPKGFKTPGVKIYHVDSRLAKIVANVGTYDEAPTLAKLAASKSGDYYNVLANNTPSYSADNPGYRLIHLLESNGVLTFDNYDASTGKDLTTSSYANDSTLFSGSEGHNRFSMKRFSSFFENGTKFNNGQAFPYSIRINQVKTDSEGASSVSLTIASA
jgi:M6 family metalloprotease-like protein